MGHSVVLPLHSPPCCVARFSLSPSCPCRTAPSSDRSSSSLVPTRPLSGPKPHCLLVFRVQALAHGQEVHEHRKLTPHLNVDERNSHQLMAQVPNPETGN